MKKITALILSVLLAMTMTPAMAFATEAGNSSAPSIQYDVNSAETLNAAIAAANAAADSSKIVINLTGNVQNAEGAAQIGAFSGKLLGNGYTITGLKGPMFGSLNNAEVSRVVFNVTSDVNGPVLAETAAGSTINRIQVTGRGKILADGGMLNRATNSHITACSNNVVVDKQSTDAKRAGSIAAVVDGGSISGCQEVSLPTAAKLTGTVTATSQVFKEDFEADNLTLALNGSSVNSMTLSSTSSSLSVTGGSVSTILTGSNTADITLNNTTVSQMSAANRAWGAITLNVRGNALLRSATAGTITVNENGGDIQKVVVENGFSMLRGAKLPSRIEKFGSPLTPDAFAGADYSGPIGSNPYIYTAKYAVKVGSKSYGTLAEAFDAAKNNDVVTLLENVNLTRITQVSGGRRVVLDLNGYTLGNANYISINGVLTIKDSSYYGYGRVNGLPGGAGKGSLILQSGKYNFDPYAYLDSGSSKGSLSSGYYTVTRNIYYCSASVPNVAYAYNGTAQKPAVTVTDSSGSKLTEGYHYTVSYANNTNVGTATITIYGKNTYTGSKSITFRINQKSLSAVKADALENQPYTGYQIRPSVTLKDGAYTLRENIDYTLTYGANKNLGSTGTVSISGRGNYIGVLTLSFRISKDISTCTFADIPDMEFTGYQLKPSITVYDGSQVLRPYNDYKVTYGANVQSGMGSVTVTGTGNYGGTKTLSFNIKGREQRITTRWNKFSKTLASVRFNLGATAQGNAKLTFTSLDPSIVTVDAAGNVTVADTGVAKILIKAAKTGAYPEAEKYVTVTVKPSKPVISAASTERGEIHVQITKKPGVGRYQIRYGRKGRYYNKYVDYADTSDLTQTKYIQGLRSGQKYFVKVRAYKKSANGTAWGAWSSTRAVRTK